MMNSGKETAVRYLISGRVQGVGFRWYTKRAADSLGLRGFVRNLSDGRVEALAIGEPEKLKELKREIFQGPSFSAVTSIDEAVASDSGRLGSFEITY